MSKQNRRDFLKISALGGLAFGLGCSEDRECCAESSDAPAAALAPSDKVNVAFIGVGGKGDANLRAISGVGANVVAVCDIDGPRLGAAALKFPKARTYVDFRKLLEQKDIDAVVVTTPDHTHAVAAMGAIKLGKHVYCEKPLCHDIYEVRMLTEAARKQKIATQMGNAANASEYMRRQAELLATGIIGRVKEIHVWTDRPGKLWPQGVNRPVETPEVPADVAWDLWLGTAPARPYHPAYHPFKWRGFWDFGTGALGDMGCHILDYPFFALKLGAPTSIECVNQEGITSESAPLASTIRYEFPAPDGGAPYTLTWRDGGRRPEAPKGIELRPTFTNGTIYIGEKGAILVPWGAVPILAGADADFRLPEKTLPRSKHGHFGDWLDACKGGPPAGVNFNYAGPLSEAVLLGNVALRTGKKIEWDSANMKARNLPEADQYLRREYRKGWAL